MAETMDAFYEWLAPGRKRDDDLPVQDFQKYVHGISQARFVLRRVIRIVDEQAKREGLEPLQHQVLLQVFGALEPLRINDIAELLDIAPAFASRLVGRLEEQGYVTRQRSETDRRISHVVTTEAGRDLLRAIDENVHVHVAYFHQQLSGLQRAAALGVVAFYVGAPLHPDTLTSLGELISPES